MIEKETEGGLEWSNYQNSDLNLSHRDALVHYFWMIFLCNSHPIDPILNSKFLFAGFFHHTKFSSIQFHFQWIILPMDRQTEAQASLCNLFPIFYWVGRGKMDCIFFYLDKFQQPKLIASLSAQAGECDRFQEFLIATVHQGGFIQLCGSQGAAYKGDVTRGPALRLDISLIWQAGRWVEQEQRQDTSAGSPLISSKVREPLQAADSRY